MTTDRQWDAYQQGLRARGYNESASDNPYSPSSAPLFHSLWLAGWLDENCRKIGQHIHDPRDRQLHDDALRFGVPHDDPVADPPLVGDGRRDIEV